MRSTELKPGMRWMEPNVALGLCARCGWKEPVRCPECELTSPCAHARSVLRPLRQGVHAVQMVRVCMDCFELTQTEGKGAIG